jgi:hypothetical protein
MSRVFAYCRVSKKELTTQNQVQEIAAAGFAVDRRRVVEETVSGVTADLILHVFLPQCDRGYEGLNDGRSSGGSPPLAFPRSAACAVRAARLLGAVRAPYARWDDGMLAANSLAASSAMTPALPERRLACSRTGRRRHRR